MNNMKQYYAVYIIIFFFSYLPDDGFLLSRDMLHYTIKYTKRVVVDGYCLPFLSSSQRDVPHRNA
jgi:hypothetical protein